MSKNARILRLKFKTGLLGVCNVLAALAAIRVRPAILMYHSFDITNWRHGISPEELLRQLEYLRTTRTVVSVTDILAWNRGEKDLPDNAVAITIDDGPDPDLTPQVLDFLARHVPLG